MTRQMIQLRWIVGFLAVGTVAGLTVYGSRPGETVHARPVDGETSENVEPAGESSSAKGRPRVAVVRPQGGGPGRTTTQPGTVEAFDFADLYSKVSGYIVSQTADIGDKVKVGQVLAQLKNPELTQDLRKAEAELEQAQAQVQQMEAAVLTAQAVRDAALALVKQSEADLVRETSTLSFRTKQYDRIKSLFELKSVDERLVDEKQEQRDAAAAAQNSARAAIVTAQAQAAAAKAKIAQAEANLVDARAKVHVANAAIERAKVFVDYTNIVSPYDGVVTKRNFHLGDLIHGGDHVGQTPLFIVARVDRMRVVLQVPERDVPFLDPGDPAIVELDALAGHKFNAKVSRIANSEDRVTRSMRAEIDLPNSANEFRDGMFGRVTIQLGRAHEGLTVPSGSVTTDARRRTGVYVVRSGTAVRVPVEVGSDDGVRAEILSGLKADDLVIRRPGDQLSDGVAVDVEPSKDVPLKTPPN